MIKCSKYFKKPTSGVFRTLWLIFGRFRIFLKNWALPVLAINGSVPSCWEPEVNKINIYWEKLNIVQAMTDPAILTLFLTISRKINICHQRKINSTNGSLSVKNHKKNKTTIPEQNCVETDINNRFLPILEFFGLICWALSLLSIQDLFTLCKESKIKKIWINGSLLRKTEHSL